jgi:hypothetical protein
MSLIQITDLHDFGDDSLIALTESETTTLVGGTAAPVAISSPLSPSSLIPPITSASSIGISSFSQNNILDVATKTKFDTSFTVSATSVKPSVSGSIDIRFLNPSAKSVAH